MISNNSNDSDVDYFTPEEIEALDKYQEFSEGYFDDNELYDIITKHKYNDAKIKEEIKSLIREKGEEYKWHEAGKKKKPKPSQEDKPPQTQVQASYKPGYKKNYYKSEYTSKQSNKELENNASEPKQQVRYYKRNNYNYNNRGNYNRNYYKRNRGGYRRGRGNKQMFSEIEVDTNAIENTPSALNDIATPQDNEKETPNTEHVDEDVIETPLKHIDEQEQKTENSNVNETVPPKQEEQPHEDKLNEKFLNEQPVVQETEIQVEQPLMQVNTVQSETIDKSVPHEEESSTCNYNKKNNNTSSNNNTNNNMTVTTKENEISYTSKSSAQSQKQKMAFSCENSAFSIQNEKPKMMIQHQQEQIKSEQPQMQQPTKQPQVQYPQMQMPQMPQMMYAPIIMQPSMQSVEQKHDKQQQQQPFMYPCMFPYYQDPEGKNKIMYPMYMPMQPYQQNPEQMQNQFQFYQFPMVYPMMGNPMAQMEQYGNNKQMK